jgi:hypothetical protein
MDKIKIVLYNLKEKILKTYDVMDWSITIIFRKNKNNNINNNNKENKIKINININIKKEHKYVNNYKNLQK